MHNMVQDVVSVLFCFDLIGSTARNISCVYFKSSLSAEAKGKKYLKKKGNENSQKNSLRLKRAKQT